MKVDSSVRSHRTHSRSASRTLLWSLSLCTLVLAGAIWFLLHEDDGGAVAGAGPTQAAEPALGEGELLGMEEEGRQGAGADVVWAPGDMMIPVGVRLGGRGRLEGFVRERESGAAVSGVRVDLLVVPPAGIELVGRIVHLARFGQEFQERYDPVATVASDAEGAFVFEGVRAGNYFLEARGARHVPDNLSEVKVAPSGAGGPVNVWVRRGGRVLGNVLRPDGTPAAGARVWCFPGPGTILTRLREGDMRGLEVRADGEGRYVIHGVPPGSGFDLAALDSTSTITHVPDIEVTAGADTHIDISLRRGSRLGGRILSRSATEEPVPLGGARVSVLPRGLRDLHFARELLEATAAVTAADGGFLARRVPPGQVDVIAWAPGHLHGMLGGVVVPEGGGVRVGDLELLRGATVEVLVSDDTGAPLEGAQASWWTADWKSFRFRFGFTPFLMQATEGFEYPRSDAEGRLTAGPFPGSPPFSMAFYLAGYQPSFEKWSPAPEFGENGELTVQLNRAGAVEGIVMDLSAGEPVRRFTLESERRLESDPAAPSGWNPFAGGILVEDEQGRFRLDGLPPGRVEMRVRSDEHLPIAVQLDVVAGETTRGVIVNMTRGGVVRGRVVDAEGLPVAGATVLATDGDGDPVRGWPRSPRIGASDSVARHNQDFGMDMLEVAHTLGSVGPGAVLSDETGAFVLHSVPTGGVHLRAWHRDHARASVGPLRVPREGMLEDIEIQMGSGGSVRGRVTDRHGRPVPGAIIVATRPDSLGGSPHGDKDVYQGHSGADGSYRIEHMAAGSYFLFLTRGDAALDPLAFLGTMNFDLVRVPAEGEVTYNLVDSSAAGTRVFGVVTSGGQPVRGGTLFALSFEGENLFGVDAKVAEVGADGTFEFPGLEPGDFQFRYGGDTAEVVLEVEVLDRAAQRVDLALPQGGLEGRVISAETGEGIGAAEVLVVRTGRGGPRGGLFGELLAAQGARVKTRTDANGAFGVERLQEGTWEIVVNPPRWGAQRGRFAPAAAQRVEVVEGALLRDIAITLEPALVVRGTVRDEAGQGIKGAQVTAYPEGASWVEAPQTRTDAEGHFELVGLSAGPWRLGVSKRGFADAPLERLNIEEGAPPDVALVLSVGVEVSVRVLGSDGQPAAGATARLLWLEGETVPEEVALRRSLEGVFEGEGIAGGDGWIELGQKTPGLYRVEALRGGRSGRLDEVRVESGAPARFEVKLE